MARSPITRLPGESHDELWGHFLRFSRWRGTGIENLAGRRFNAWIVLGLEGWGEKGPVWLVRCDCGTLAARTLRPLAIGTSRSCGCHDRITHGMSRTRPYRIWAGMLTRCQNPNDDAFMNYGGRGIEVCEQWGLFENFWSDMKDGYAQNLTLERRDVNGNYEPSNCCWITKSDQLQNLRRTIRIQTPHGPMTLRQASNAFGINRDTLRARIRYGWPESRLLEGYC